MAASTTISTDPALLRGIFGENLRELCRSYPSIAGLCRDLGINRTQFNRYLSSESFPRPDVLHRICTFFDVDARILLEPVATLSKPNSELLSHPKVAEFLGDSTTQVSEQDFPSGFFRFSRPSFMDESKFITGLVYVFREDGYTFIRGFEAKEAMHQQGLDITAPNRDFRGVVLHQEDGVAALISRRGSMTCSFHFLARVTAFQENFWEGYATRTSRESISGQRVARMVYEYVNHNRAATLDAARKAGFCSEEDLLPFHRRLLHTDTPFR